MFLQILLYIFITVGCIVSAAGGILGCIYFIAFLLFMLVFYAAPQLALVICYILLLAWGLDKQQTGNFIYIMSNHQAFIEYLLNKGCPYLVLSFLLFHNFKLTDVSLYGIIGSVLFIDWYSRRIGIAIGVYENNPEFRKMIDKSIEEDS